VSRRDRPGSGGPGPGGGAPAAAARVHRGRRSRHPVTGALPRMPPPSRPGVICGATCEAQ